MKITIISGNSRLRGVQKKNYKPRLT